MERIYDQISAEMLPTCDMRPTFVLGTPLLVFVPRGSGLEQVDSLQGHRQIKYSIRLRYQ